MTEKPNEIIEQPVDSIQLNQLIVEWVTRDSIKPNKYNPNVMNSQDRTLLRQSLLEDGWTQPIVTLVDQTIVDGEQRWTTSGIYLDPVDVDEIIAKMLRRGEQGAVVSESILQRLRTSRERLYPVFDAFEGRVKQAYADAGKPGKFSDFKQDFFYKTPTNERPCIAVVTGGLVPITRVDFPDDAHRMISTIRHNRARGQHVQDRMGEIATDLMQLGLDFGDLQNRLGMDSEEAQRLLETATQAQQLLEQSSKREFGGAWEVKSLNTLAEDDPVFKEELARSAAVEQVKKEAQMRQWEYEQEVAKKVEEAAKQKETDTGLPMSHLEKVALKGKIEKEFKPPEKQNPSTEVRRLTMFITHAEYAMVVEALGGLEKDMAKHLVIVCQNIVNQKRGIATNAETITQDLSDSPESLDSLPSGDS